MQKQLYTANTNLWSIILPAGYVQQHTSAHRQNTTPINRIFLYCRAHTRAVVQVLLDDRTQRAVQDHKMLTLKGLPG